jgi:hypothetical protein
LPSVSAEELGDETRRVLHVGGNLYKFILGLLLSAVWRDLPVKSTKTKKMCTGAEVEGSEDHLQLKYPGSQT